MNSRKVVVCTLIGAVSLLNIAGCSRAWRDGVSIGLTDGLSDGIAQVISDIITSTRPGDE